MSCCCNKRVLKTMSDALDEALEEVEHCKGIAQHRTDQVESLENDLAGEVRRRELAERRLRETDERKTELWDRLLAAERQLYDQERVTSIPGRYITTVEVDAVRTISLVLTKELP